MGTRFIATKEAVAQPGYKEMIVKAAASDIMYTPFFSGVPANYLRPSVVRAGLDPENLGAVDKSKMDFNQNSDGHSAKAWRDIWGAGQGVGCVDDVPTTAELVARLHKEYTETKASLSKL